MKKMLIVLSMLYVMMVGFSGVSVASDYQVEQIGVSDTYHANILKAEISGRFESLVAQETETVSIKSKNKTGVFGFDDLHVSIVSMKHNYANHFCLKNLSIANIGALVKHSHQVYSKPEIVFMS